MTVNTRQGTGQRRTFIPGGREIEVQNLAVLIDRAPMVAGLARNLNLFHFEVPAKLHHPSYLADRAGGR